jgi:hypothetical protein
VQVQTKKAMMRELAGSIADLQEQLRFTITIIVQ